jgi:hypothetical protein
MASQVGGDLSKIQAGPCKLTYSGNTVGHTMDGFKFTVAPDLLVRNVDEYGTMKADVILQVTNADMSVTLAQWMGAVLRMVYQWGNTSYASYIGLGRIPGLRGQDVAKQLIAHPLDQGASTTYDVEFFKVVVQQPQEVQFGVVTGDRVSAVQMTALVDESKGDDGMLGRIGHAAVA